MFNDVVVAVRHPVMRRGVSALLSESKELNVVAEVGEFTSLHDVCVNTNPRIIVVDSVMVSLQKEFSLADLTKRHRLRRFVVLWLHEKPSEQELSQAQYNVELQWSDPSALAAGVLNSLNEIPVPGYMLRRTMEPQKLTVRENEVLENIAMGLSTAEIADRLAISSRTAELHRYRICRKLGISSPFELAKYLVRKGLVTV